MKYYLSIVCESNDYTVAPDDYTEYFIKIIGGKAFLMVMKECQIVCLFAIDKLEEFAALEKLND